MLKQTYSYARRRTEIADKAAETGRRAGAFPRAAEGAAGDLRDKNRKWADDELLRERLYKSIAEFDARQEARFRVAADRPWDQPLAPPPVEVGFQDTGNGVDP